MGFFDYRDSIHGVGMDGDGERREVPKNESLAEHLKDCEAKHCTFLRPYDKEKLDLLEGVDDHDVQLVTAEENGKVETVVVNPSNPVGSVAFGKLAAVMSDMWKYASGLNPDKDDERIVKDVIEKGLSAMNDELDEKDCKTKADDEKEQIVILPPDVK